MRNSAIQSLAFSASSVCSCSGDFLAAIVETRHMGIPRRSTTAICCDPSCRIVIVQSAGARGCWRGASALSRFMAVLLSFAEENKHDLRGWVPTASSGKFLKSHPGTLWTQLAAQSRKYSAWPTEARATRAWLELRCQQHGGGTGGSLRRCACLNLRSLSLHCWWKTGASGPFVAGRPPLPSSRSGHAPLLSSLSFGPT